MKHLFAFFLLLSMLAGCDSETSTGTGTDNLLRGTLRGRVELNSIPNLVDATSSGIKVSLEGTALSTVTNDSGDWELKDVPTSTYTIVYEKNGYGLRKYISYQFVGGGTSYAPPAELQKIASTHAELFYVAMKDTLSPEYPNQPPSKRIIIKATIADTAEYYYSWFAVIFFSKTPNVSSNPNTYDIVLPSRQLWNSYSDTTQTYTIRPLKDSMISTTLPFGYAKSGETIYVTAYGGYYGGSPQGDYYDPSIRKSYYTSLSPHRSQVLSFIVP